MITVRKAADRGRNDRDWLMARATFSFGAYQDPNHSGFRSLRVMNDDVIAPGKGFGPHAHRDMEIITYVVEGHILHRDSLGSRRLTGPNEVQTMTAGTGVVHSEFNGSETEPLRVLQIWIEPVSEDLEPSYQQISFSPDEKRGRLRLLAGPRPSDDEKSTVIHQDALLYTSNLSRGESVSYTLPTNRYGWVQVVSGAVRVNGIDLKEGDGAAINDEREILISTGPDAAGEILLFDLA